MAFLETPRFPEEISVGSKFGPRFSTGIARNIGGAEASNQNWIYPLHRGDVRHGVKTQAQLNTLLQFFHGTAGMHNRWRFKDPKDYTHSQGGGTGTVVLISGNNYQMLKTYTVGALSTLRKISKPVSATVAVQGGGSYSVDYTTGIITRNSGAAPTGWTGEFDVPCRFDLDEMLPTWITFELFSWEVPIVEVRL